MKFLLVPLIAVSHFFNPNSEPINFDGKIDPSEWENAQIFTIDYEISPGNNAPSPNKTRAYVKYSSEYLWVGFDAEVSPEKLRSALRNRDEAFSDDIVMIAIDTYGDGRYMVAVGANAEASQVDLKFMPNGNDDDSYDVSFESKAVKTLRGYQVELKIPFSAFQFKNTPELAWNVLFYRSTYSDGARSQNINFPLDLNNSCFPCQTPEKIILKNIKPKQRRQLLPFAFGGLSGERENNSIVYGKGNYNVGFGGLLDISNVTSLEFTINPDFSQVEADVSQINANSTFALYFPERRPFFNEGKDLIGTQLRTVYTRAINQPLLSTKMIYQGKKQQLYWLSAYDSKTAYLIGGENESYFGQGEENFSNILRYQRTFDQGSNFGFLTTNRFLKGGGMDNTIGFLGKLRLLKSYTLGIEWNKSFTKEAINDWIDSSDSIENKTVILDGETFNGDALNFSLERNTENWSSEIEYQHNSPLYRTPLGFSVNNSLRSLEISQSYQYFFKDKFLKKFVLDGELETRFNFNGIQKYSGIDFSTYLELDKNIRSRINFSHTFNQEYKGYYAKSLFEYSWWFQLNPSEAIRINVYTELGESIGYNLDDPTVGNSLFFGTFNSFQLSDKLRISPSFRYSELRSKQDNSLYYKGYITRLNLNYQFNNNLSFRLVGELDNFDDRFFIQPLLKWNPNPFTIFYIGGNTGYSHFDNNDTFDIASSQYYLKFQYLIGI